MADLDTILERLDNLEAENLALRATLAELTAAPAASGSVAPGDREPWAPTMPAPMAERVSRRLLLRRAGSGMAAAGAGAVVASVASAATAGTALAAGMDGQVMKVGGNYYDATTTTNLWNQTNENTTLRVVGMQGTALLVSSRAIGLAANGNPAIRANGTILADVGGQGNPMRAKAVNGKAVWATSDTDAALFGVSKDGIGGYGQSATNDGLMGVATGDGRGVRGESATGAGVFGFSGTYRETRQGVGSVGVYGRSDSGRGVVGASTGGDGVRGTSAGGSGVHGVSSATGGVNAGVFGESEGRWGVYGRSTTDAGVRGASEQGLGMYAQSVSGHGFLGVALGSQAGVRAESATGTAVFGFSGPYQGERTIPGDVGVVGQSANGRGAVFGGPVAQVQLKASSAATHPDTGAKGDLFVDDSGRLWFCKGGGGWTQLA